MSAWVKVLSEAEIEASHAFTAGLDPAFAAREKAFYQSRSLAQLQGLASEAWNCNEPGGYQMARSYAALKGA